MRHAIHVKSILNKTKKTDSWFLSDYSINAYSGCSFNCLYCYIRGSKYGFNMAEKVSIKSNAVSVLDKQLALRAKKKEYGFIVMSSSTDPYLHFEKDEKLTQQVLEVIAKHRFPLHVITKSNLILRDVELLQYIAKHAIVPEQLYAQLQTGLLVSFSFATVDNGISKIFESGATPPTIRLETIQQLQQQYGLHCGISMMPLLPYISDTTESLNNMFTAFKQVGVKYILPSTITLFGNDIHDSRTLVFRAVEKHYPHLLPKYQKLLGTHDYLPQYYNYAFQQKMQEMSKAFNIPLRIAKL